MRSLITMALSGGLLTLAMTPALVQAATNAPQVATKAGRKADIEAVSPGSMKGNPSASGATAAGKAPIAAAMPAPAAATAVRVQLISKTGLFYPREALLRGIVGCVHLSMFVSRSGYPIVIGAVYSQPPGVFDAAALQAARDFRFRVTDLAGGPVSAETLPRGVHVQVPIGYYLEGDSTKATNRLCALPQPRTLIVGASTADAPGTIRIISRDNDSGATHLSGVIGAKKAILLKQHLMAHDLVTMPVPAGQILRSGWVKMRFCIRADGRITQPWVTDSSPHGLYDQAAIAALRTWKFPSWKRQGKNVQVCRLTYTIPVIARRDLEKGPVAVRAAATFVSLHYVPNDNRHHDYIRGGKVLTRFCVEANGSLSNVEAVEPRLPNPLAVAAVDVLESFQYWPRQVDGKWVRTCNIEQTLQFTGGKGLLSVHG